MAPRSKPSVSNSSSSSVSQKRAADTREDKQEAKRAQYGGGIEQLFGRKQANNTTTTGDESVTQVSAQKGVSLPQAGQYDELSAVTSSAQESNMAQSSTVAAVQVAKSQVSPVKDEDGLWDGMSDADLLNALGATTGTHDVDDFGDFPDDADVFNDINETKAQDAKSSAATGTDEEEEGEELPAEFIRSVNLAELVVCPPRNKLSLRAILLYMVTVIIALAVASVEDAACFTALDAEDLVTTFLAGMPSEARDYIDRCLERQEAWDTFRLFKLLHQRATFGSDHGIYLIGLVTQYLRLYGGCAYSSGGLTKRMDEHFSYTYRRRVTKKLYNAWDSKKFPVKRILTGAITLPQRLYTLLGNAPILVLETAATILFSAPTNGPLVPILYTVLPPTLVEIFRDYAGLDSHCLTAEVMGAAFSKASRMVTTSSLNWSVPFTEQMRLKPRVTRLLEGITTTVFFKIKSREQRVIKLTSGQGYHIQLNNIFGEMEKDGFSMDRPTVTVKMELHDKLHPDNWAQVQEHSGSAANAVGYELAHRITLMLMYNRADSTRGRTYVKMESRGHSAVRRVALVMSFYEFATAVLPPADGVFPRNRVDLLKGIESQEVDGEKAWLAGQPEEEEFANAELKMFRCKNPNCNKRFEHIDYVKQHYGFYKGEYGAERLERQRQCRQAAGVSSSKDVTEKSHLVEGMSLKDRKTRDNKVAYRCARSACGQTFINTTNLKKHLGLHGDNPKAKTSKKGSRKNGPSESTLLCRAAYQNQPCKNWTDRFDDKSLKEQSQP